MADYRSGTDATDQPLGTPAFGLRFDIQTDLSGGPTDDNGYRPAGVDGKLAPIQFNRYGGLRTGYELLAPSEAATYVPQGEKNRGALVHDDETRQLLERQNVLLTQIRDVLLWLKEPMGALAPIVD